MPQSSDTAKGPYTVDSSTRQHWNGSESRQYEWRPANVILITGLQEADEQIQIQALEVSNYSSQIHFTANNESWLTRPSATSYTADLHPHCHPPGSETIPYDCALLRNGLGSSWPPGEDRGLMPLAMD